MKNNMNVASSKEEKEKLNKYLQGRKKNLNIQLIVFTYSSLSTLNNNGKKSKETKEIILRNNTEQNKTDGN